MLLIERPQTDPYFNIAAEEYLLRSLEEDCFMLWVNEPSVIIGKHQNAFAEINREYVAEKHIPVIRRISGGGTVFHGHGNLNFTFISKGEKEKLVDFRKFTRPVIHYLESLGLPARFEGKNDIRINGLKVSGNAEHVFRDKVLHHGTLLYSAGLDMLNRAIRGKEELYKSHAVKSVRSKVANISDLLEQPPPLAAFREGIIARVANAYPHIRDASLSDDDILAIRNLAEKKYRTWEWNYGYSPAFKYARMVRFGEMTIEVSLEVRNGIIGEVTVGHASLSELPGLIRGKRFNAGDLLATLGEDAAQGTAERKEYASLIAELLH